uniref:Uncharacterized protein n=1 Tax=Morchella importuna TaxID=1174673 RepID=A0A650AFA7_9PEZI|nr:hypothetical protein [Morchella importuna]QGN66710.1 hypothetical protein [Morchella importuna]
MIINKALLKKNGYSNFSLETLEYCEKEKAISRWPCPCTGAGGGSWSCCNYIDLRPVKGEYNILHTAGSSLGFRHSEESLKKMRGLVENLLRLFPGRLREPMEE